MGKRTDCRLSEPKFEHFMQLLGFGRLQKQHCFVEMHVFLCISISCAREGEKINSVIMSHFGIIHKA